MDKNLPIGVFDSGVGGMTVASSVARILPGERIFYFGDTARCPYGDRTSDEVHEYALQTLDFLYEQGVKMLVVACNTATAIALPDLVRRYDIPVLGVIGPGAQSALAASRSRRIGVIGTSVTIQSNAYALEVYRRDPDAQVYSLSCPAFVPMVESGRLSGPDVCLTVSAALQPLLETTIDVLILGCTHYPLLREPIQKAVGPSVRLISSAEETARQVDAYLSGAGLRAEIESPHHRFFTTGDGTRMARAAKGFLGIQSPDVSCVSVSKLAAQANHI